MSLQSRSFVFTLNNANRDWLDAEDIKTFINDFSNIRYAVWQKECAPSTSMLHLQGYIEFKKPVRLPACKSYFVFNDVHLEKRKGTREQARAYCKKEESRVQGPFEYGEWIQGPGKRSDLDEVQEAIKNGATANDIDEQFPKQAAKYHSWVQRRLAAHQLEILRPPQIELRPWQTGLRDLLLGPPHPRKIHWYWEETGNSGKSTFARWFLLSYKTLSVKIFRGGRNVDVAFAYQCERVVFFDYPRDSLDYISYSTLEHLKDGCIFSSKYESVSKIFDPPHVIVFANREPDRSRLSADRWDVHHIFNPTRVN